MFISKVKRLSVMLTAVLNPALGSPAENEQHPTHRIKSNPCTACAYPKTTLSFADQSIFNNPTARLTDYIPPPYTKRSALEQTLSEWVKDANQDYQLLEFTPENLTIQIAFLRLIGISKVSLKDLNRVKGTKTCFLNKIGMLDTTSQPKLTLTEEEVIATISEFNSDRAISKFLPAIGLKELDHVKPSIIENSHFIFNEHILESFYKTMSHSTDEEFISFCDQFLIGENKQSKQMLFDQLKKARALCKHYLDSDLNPESVRPQF